MSALTQQPLRVHHIRGALRKPGINSEDLCIIRALSQMCAAKTDGDDLGQYDLAFKPTRAPRGLNTRLDIHGFENGVVPGNALIVLESLLPVLARTGVFSKVIVQGETHNPNTLTYDAFERITLACHRKQGLYAFPNLALAGYGFGAKGEVGLEVEPSSLTAIKWQQRGELVGCGAVVTTSELSAEIGDRGRTHAELLFKGAGMKVEAEHIEVRSRGPGVHVTLWAEFENGRGSASCSGQKGLRIEKVVDNAFDDLKAWLATDATVDPFLADQLVLPAVFAEGESIYTTSCVTRRLTTMAWVVKQFLPIHVTVLGVEGSPGTVRISR
jgi:RNA 3'-terminal phosphate cyclase (ATP)